ncbi:MAG: hypothetical protein MK108_17965 [Mariniblastus sp.]|jgi:hypothetical protein|nr:hypothetical protein [Mariniblastus sp.]
MAHRVTAIYLAIAVLLGLVIGRMTGQQSATAEARETRELGQLDVSGIEINSGSGPTIDLSEGGHLRASIGAQTDSRFTDSVQGGSLAFSTRAADGAVNKNMQLTKEGCLLVGREDAIAGVGGSIETAMDHPSRPGALVMRNVHDPTLGCGVTIAFYASGEHQASMSSSWLGETRHVKQIDKPDLPHGRVSPPYPGPRSAARMEINGRVNDWASNMAIFEPIADDGKAFVTCDRAHPFMNGQVQYLPPSGEWINGRRIGRHAFLVGTTHNTGATAGGIVMAGDSYHENKGMGPVIKSPNGTAFRIIVDDDGNLSTEKF